MDVTETDTAAPPVARRAGPIDELRGPLLRKALSLATIAWLFGSVWMTAVCGTPQTNTALALRASEFQFGLLSALPFIASLLSLPASILAEATGQRKKIFIWALYFNRLLWIPIGLVPLWIVSAYPGTESVAMILFLGLLFVMHSGQAIGSPAWVSWMADIVPDRKRGKYFSQRRQWGIITAVPTALIVGWLLDRHVGKGDWHLMLKWCAGIFVVSSIFGFLDIHLFNYVPDVPRAPRKGQHLLRAMKEPLKNRQFLYMAGFVATLVFAVSFMGQFVTKYIMEQVSGGDRANSTNMVTQMMLIVAPNIAALLVVGTVGRAADRMGKKPLLALASLGLAPVAAGWCFVTGSNPWLGYALSMAGSALWCGVDVANWNLVMEMSGSDSNNGNTGGTAYSAVNSIVINVAGMLGGLASGIIAQWLHDWHWQTAIKTFTYYDVLFGLSAVLRLLGVVIFLPLVHEANARPTHDTLKFMTMNFYNNLFAAIQQPFKLLKLARRED